MIQELHLKCGPQWQIHLLLFFFFGLRVNSFLAIVFPLISVHTRKVYSTVGSMSLNFVLFKATESPFSGCIEAISVSPNTLSFVSFLGLQCETPSLLKACMDPELRDGATSTV